MGALADVLIQDYRIADLRLDRGEIDADAASVQLSDLAAQGYTVMLSPASGFVLMARPVGVMRIPVEAPSILAGAMPGPSSGNGGLRGLPRT